MTSNPSGKYFIVIISCWAQETNYAKCEASLFSKNKKSRYLLASNETCNEQWGSIVILLNHFSVYLMLLNL